MFDLWEVGGLPVSIESCVGEGSGSKVEREGTTGRCKSVR